MTENRRFLCFLPLADTPAAISPDAVIAAARRLRPEVRIEALGDATKSVLMFRLDGQIAVILLVEAPMPAEELAAAARAAWWWPEAEAACRRQRSHLIVSDMSPPDTDPLGAARRATLLTAAVAEVLAAPIAALWGASQVLQPADRLGDIAREPLPADLWLDLRLLEHEGGLLGLVVRGLAAFVGREMVVAGTPLLAPADLARRTLDVASYLINNGPVIRDGETVGINATERIRVAFREDARAGGPIYALTVERAG